MLKYMGDVINFEMCFPRKMHEVWVRNTYRIYGTGILTYVYQKISQIDVNMPYIDRVGCNDPLKMYDTKHTLFPPVRFLDASGLVVLRCQPICIATSSHCILAIFLGGKLFTSRKYPPKIGLPKRSLIFQPSFLRGYVKLRGSMLWVEFIRFLWCMFFWGTFLPIQVKGSPIFREFAVLEPPRPNLEQLGWKDGKLHVIHLGDACASKMDRSCHFLGGFASLEV